MTDQDLINTWNGLKDFNNENEMQEYVVSNVDLWVKDFWNCEVKKTHEQYYFGDIKYFGANKPKIDLCLELTSGKKIGIEIKNPTQRYSELSRSVSQLLSYAVLAEESGRGFDELIIITSGFDPILTKIIKRFNLPIRIFIFNKHIHCEIK